MKTILSVSLGSDTRDKSVEIELLGEKFRLLRIGTNGNFNKAIELIKENDGKVEAIGLGGIDLYLFAGGKRFIIKDALKLLNAAKKTPIVDGSGLKNTLERTVVEYLYNDLKILNLTHKILLVSAVDRFGMAESFSNFGFEIIFGDFIFSLGLPVPLRSLNAVKIVAYIFLPILTKLPFQILYPTGKKQEVRRPAYKNYFLWADVIAGDLHFIRRKMPDKLNDKIVLTNTVTQNDVELFKKADAKYLITTTPEMDGRSFGTNVMEALLISILNKKPEEVKENDYVELLSKIGFKPTIRKLN